MGFNRAFVFLAAVGLSSAVRVQNLGGCDAETIKTVLASPETQRLLGNQVHDEDVLKKFLSPASLEITTPEGKQSINLADQTLGGDADVHGCAPSTGSRWCEAYNKCVRPWEIANDEDSFYSVCGGERSDSEDTISWSTIWAIGKEVWTVINDNQASVNYSIDFAGAVPANVTDWESFSGWTPANHGGFKFEFKNFVGMRLTEFDWTWDWKCKGAYEEIGQYVTQATAYVNTIYAYLSENVDVNVVSSKPLNYGNKTAPVGGIDLLLTMKSSGCFESTTVGCQITLKGDCTYKVEQCAQGNH